jgi:ubiquinone/menaquinone biosynthesis C-methylase UbiE
MSEKGKKPFVCPWWIGYFLLSPVRRWAHNPESILSPYVREGMTVLEVGPGMGYFTLPLARLVGKTGRVLCVDVQAKMLAGLKRRAEKAGLNERITAIQASEDALHLEMLRGTADFTLLFAMVHEVPDQSHFFQEVYEVMKPGSRLLLSEPTGHVKEADFRQTTGFATARGFTIEKTLDIKRSFSAVLKKNG